MIQKGIIEKVIDKYTYKVRIPKYDKVYDDPEYVDTDNLSDGLVCITPGVNVSYYLNDVVIISFENDELDKPIILGLLYRENLENNYSDTTITNVESNIEELESSITEIKSSSSIYTHIRYSNDNGNTFTSLFNPVNYEKEDSEGNIYCVPSFSSKGVNGIEIDKSSEVITWFIADEDNNDITDQIGIDTILLDSSGNVLRTIPKKNKNYTISLNNETYIEGKLLLTYRIYTTKERLDRLHVTLSTDKNILGTTEGKYLGIYVSNDSIASSEISDYKWFSVNSNAYNEMSELISELEETTGTLKEQMTEVTTDVDGFRVSVVEAVTTAQSARNTADAVREAADRGDFDGRGIVSTEIKYQGSSSNTEIPSGTWYTIDDMPIVPDGHYLWTWTKITYTDNTYSSSYSVAKQGVQGQQGIPGLNDATILLYKRGSTAPTKPSGNLIYNFSTHSISEDSGASLRGWSQNIPTADGDPCWVIAASASSNALTDIITDTEWSTQIKFVEDGKDGGVGAHGINTATIYLYQRRSSQPQVPSNLITYNFSTKTISGTIDNNWETNIGSLSGSNPIWVIAATASSNTDEDTIGSSEWSTPIKLSQDGVSISSVVNYYLASAYSTGITHSTPGWTTEIQTMTSSKQFLWNYEVSIGSNGATLNTTSPVIIGRYGQDGNQGVAGKGIESIVEWYQISNDKINPPETPSAAGTGYSNTPIPTTQVNPYLWNYEVISYTSGDPTITSARVIGTHGEDGLNQATINVYKRSSIQPNKPDGITYTFSTGDFTVPSGWSKTIPNVDANKTPCWVSTVVAISNSSQVSISSSSWSSPIKMVEDGIDGLNQATIFLYKRVSGEEPYKPSGTATYNFTTGILTNIPSGWTDYIPDGNQTCYVSTGAAIGRSSTATISEWSDVTKLVENGLDGTDGYNQATLNLYIRSDSQPTQPGSGTTYNFSTNTISGNIGNWTTSVPSGTSPCWLTSASAISRLTSNVPLTWSSPIKLVQDGQAGLNQATINLYKRANSVTAPTVNVKYKFSDGTLRNNSDQIITTLQEWTRNIPTGTEQCWIISASAISNTDEYTISTSRWSAPVKLVKDGTSATQYYTFVKYARDSSGTDMQPSPSSGLNYIGTYTGTDSNPSASLYTWSKYVGDDGQDGTSVSVSNIKYAVTSTDTEPSSWPYTTVPEVDEGEWLWSKVFLSDGNSIISKAKSGTSGSDGIDGLNQANICLYQRASSAPSKPNSQLYYRFSDAKFSSDGSTWSDSIGNWNKTIPSVDSNGNPCWVISSVAISSQATDTIETNEWTGPNKIAENGLNQAVVRLYKRAAEAPVDIYSKPSGSLTYTFATSALTPSSSFNGWSTDIPASTSDSQPCWFISAVAASFGASDIIYTSDWSSPTQLIKDGVGISLVEEEFSLSSSSTEFVPYPGPNANWSNVPPSYVSGKYYWKRDHIVFDNNANEYTTPVYSRSMTESYQRIEHIETHYLTTSAFDVEKELIQGRVSKTELELIGEYAVCQTGADVSAKVGTITPQTTSWSLTADKEVTVQFVYQNNTASPTLNINNTGAKPIKDSSGNNLTEEQARWPAGSILLFKYDGTNYRLQDELKFDRLNKDETIISQTANNVLIKATSSNATASDKEAAGQEAIGLINVSPDSVKIQANHVDIEGAAIFSSIESESQYIYISKQSTDSTPSPKTDSWVTFNGQAQNSWSTTRPTYNVTYPKLYIARQYKLAGDDSIYCTQPVLDTTTTVIDGGNIITGSIEANKIKSRSLTISNIADESYDVLMAGNADLQKYAVPAAATGRYIKLGHLTTSVGSGVPLGVVIKIFFNGTGTDTSSAYKYNANTVMQLRPRTTTTASAAYEVTVYRERQSSSAYASNFVYATTYTETKKECDVYLYTRYAIGDGYYTIEGEYDSWEHSGDISSSSPSGTSQTIDYKSNFGDYIVDVNGTGIVISPYNPAHSTAPSNRVIIDGSGMNIYTNDVSVAQYGTTARIGQTEKDYISLANSSIVLNIEGTGMAMKIDNEGTSISRSITHSIYPPSNGYTPTTNYREEVPEFANVASGAAISVSVFYGIPSRGPYYGTFYKGTAATVQDATTDCKVQYDGNRTFTVNSYSGTGILFVVSLDATATGKTPTFTFGKRLERYAGTTYNKGAYSIVGGYSSRAEGDYSTSFGYTSVASGDYAFAAGRNARAEGDESVALGSGSAERDESFAVGDGAWARYDNQIAVGKYNNPNTSTNIFMVGNGSSSLSRSNALEVSNTGIVNVPSGGAYLINGSPHTHPYSELTGVASSSHTHSTLTHSSISIQTTSYVSVTIGANGYKTGSVACPTVTNFAPRCIVGWNWNNQTSSQSGETIPFFSRVYVDQTEKKVYFTARNCTDKQITTSARFFVLYTRNS